MRDAGVQLPYYYKRNPAKKQDIIQSRPHSKIVWAALRLSYTEKGSTQARPSSHAAMLSAAKLKPTHSCVSHRIVLYFRQYHIILSADTASEVRQMPSQKRR